MSYKNLKSTKEDEMQRWKRLTEWWHPKHYKVLWSQQKRLAVNSSQAWNGIITYGVWVFCTDPSCSHSLPIRKQKFDFFPPLFFTLTGNVQWCLKNSRNLLFHHNCFYTMHGSNCDGTVYVSWILSCSLHIFKKKLNLKTHSDWLKQKLNFQAPTVPLLFGVLRTSLELVYYNIYM